MTPERKKLLDGKTKILKALAHPTRLYIVEELMDGEQCVCHFVEKIKADFSTISRHLSVLKNAGLIVDEKRGKQVFYSLKITCLKGFFACVEAAMFDSSGPCSCESVAQTN